MVLSLITVGVVRWQRQRPYLLVGWLWYLGMLVPVIGLLQVGSQARADRYTYLPHIGLYVMVAWGAVDLGGVWRGRRVVLATAAALILTGLLVLAQVQTAVLARQCFPLDAHAGLHVRKFPGPQQFRARVGRTREVAGSHSTLRAGAPTQTGLRRSPQ